MSFAVTEGVSVEVKSAYLPERSSPAQGQYFFSYTVRIANVGEGPVRLVSRHWVITDGRGHVEEVEGPGVVGKQPVIDPGESFQYTSGCPLGTPWGAMQGSYRMERPDGSSFEAEIAPFELEAPAHARARLPN